MLQKIGLYDIVYNLENFLNSCCKIGGRNWPYLRILTLQTRQVLWNRPLEGKQQECVVTNSLAVTLTRLHYFTAQDVSDHCKTLS